MPRNDGGSAARTFETTGVFGPGYRPLGQSGSSLADWKLEQVDVTMAVAVGCQHFLAWNVMNRWSLIIVAVFALAGFSQAGLGQENDPTAKSDIITKTLSKIRDVEKLDGFVEQNQLLKAENKQLKTELASIKKQLAKLTADFEQQNAKIRKQLLQTPTFQVLSKVISGPSSMALLKTSKTQLRVKANTKLSVPVSEGAWVLMEVREISKDMIVLYFPELEREVFLYD